MKPWIIDASHHQSRIDFPALKEIGVKAIILKATEGERYVDVTFNKRIDLALESGLLVGAYHFGTSGDVSNQVRNFLETLYPHLAALENILPVLDYETAAKPQNTMRLGQCEEFIRQVTEALGRPIVLYFGHELREQAPLVAADSPIRDCIPWAADYRSNATMLKAFPSDLFKKGPVLWQYSGTAKLSSVTGTVDLDSIEADMDGDGDIDHEDVEALWRKVKP